MASAAKEIIVMMGYPASGKTTLANSMRNYYRVDGDSLKTAAAMKKEAEKHVESENIIFDCTAATKEKRAEFIAFAKKYERPIRLFWVQTPMEEAMKRNRKRAEAGGADVPAVVFYVYRKKLEPPTEEEGFTEICTY